KQRCLSVLIILLSLIAHQHINSEPTPRPIGPGNELNRATVCQLYSLLTVSLSDILDHLGKLRILSLILKKRSNTQKSLTSCFNLMRRMQNLQPKNSHKKQFDHLEDRIFPILPGDS